MALPVFLKNYFEKFPVLFSKIISIDLYIYIEG